MNRILKPLAAGFELGTTLRTAAYRKGWFETRRLHRPVISIGNLTVGGTGKTPLAAFLAEQLSERGWKPSVLTRGYRRRGSDLVVIKPAGERAADPREVGDEPALLARKLPQIPIVVCADRHRAGCVAEARFDIDVHILDDGFQHLALAREVDVVVLDVTQEFSDRALLPAGRLREPCAALGRAHFAILSRSELADPTPLESQVRKINPNIQIFTSVTKLDSLSDVENGRLYPPGAFQSEPVSAFCGIGNPQAFFADLRHWGFTIVTQELFADHHSYSPKTVAALAVASKKQNLAALVTTEKDAMNLPPLGKLPLPILACAVRPEINDREAFVEALVARLDSSRVSV